MKRTAKIRWIVAAFAMFTFLWIGYDLISGNLSGFIYFEILRRLGHTAIIMLIGSSLTLLLQQLGWKQAMLPHQVFGLFALLYASSHLFVFLLSYNFNVPAIFQAITYQKFILLGEFALISLIAVEVSSTRKLRKKNMKVWRWIHRVYYLVVPAILLHITLASKIIKPIFIVYYIAFGLIILLHFILAYQKQAQKKKRQEAAAE